MWSSLRASLSPDLKVTRALPLAAIPVGCKLLRYSHTPVASLSDLPEVISSRRVWVQVVNPLRPDRELSSESRAVIDMWLDIASSPCPFRSLFLRPLFVCEAFADACADSALAGFGGFIRLPDSRQACFACSFSAEQLADMFPWFPSGASPQHCIAAWEMLVQIGLLWTLAVLLPPGHVPIHVVFRTDNSPSQSAACVACANSCEPSTCYRTLSAFQSIWIPSLDFSMTQLMLLAEVFRLTLSVFSPPRFCPSPGHHFRLNPLWNFIPLLTLCPVSWLPELSELNF